VSCSPGRSPILRPETGEFGNGDLNGDGLARIHLDPSAQRVCFVVRWSDIDEPAAGHIREGAVGINGPIVVDLLANANQFRHRDGSGRARGCVEGMPEDLIEEIGTNPEAFYVNLHNGAFPGEQSGGTSKTTRTASKGHHIARGDWRAQRLLERPVKKSSSAGSSLPTVCAKNGDRISEVDGL
jgi:hypothetical protein